MTQPSPSQVGAFSLEEIDFHLARWWGELIREGIDLFRSWCGSAIERTAQGSFDELTAVNFHRRQRTEIAGEVLGGKRASFFDGFSFQQFCRHRRHGNGGLAAEALKTRAIDDLLAVLFGELQPHPQHVAAIGRADCADAIGIGHFSLILRIAQRLADIFFKIAHAAPYEQCRKNASRHALEI